jgi:hypothetical protein
MKVLESPKTILANAALDLSEQPIDIPEKQVGLAKAQLPECIDSAAGPVHMSLLYSAEKNVFPCAIIGNNESEAIPLMKRIKKIVA